MKMVYRKIPIKSIKVKYYKMSTNDANIWTPDTYPTAWEIVE